MDYRYARCCRLQGFRPTPLQGLVVGQAAQAKLDLPLLKKDIHLFEVSDDTSLRLRGRMRSLHAILISRMAPKKTFGYPGIKSMSTASQGFGLTAYVGVRLDPNQLSELNEFARQRGIPRAFVVRWAVKRLLADQKNLMA